ncbi:SRPBCC family protein [Luteimonas salinilitoris]|uniref:SRPBCC domain-containing protein n=1 Tax=Luteimonas salinilitoris TaxID=3237697 RepID=A0ABV4HLM3_9GAMM
MSRRDPHVPVIDRAPEPTGTNRNHRMVTLYHQIWIDAPATAVYDALATAKGLGRWWAPHTSTGTGDGLVLAHSPGPAHGDVRMKVLECVPARRVAWEIVSRHPARSPASAWAGTRIAFDLDERPSPGQWLGLDDEGKAMTVLDFRHAGWDPDSEFIGFCNTAWGVTLDMLRKHCEPSR